MSSPSQRQLEPEENDQTRKTLGTEGEYRPDNSSTDAIPEKNRVAYEPKLVKVPGGEYCGQMNEEGQKHGEGKMKYDNDNGYQGQWKNNKRDGKGITTYASGNHYDGEPIQNTTHRVVYKLYFLSSNATHGTENKKDLSVSWPNQSTHILSATSSEQAPGRQANGTALARFTSRRAGNITEATGSKGSSQALALTSTPTGNWT